MVRSYLEVKCLHKRIKTIFVALFLVIIIYFAIGGVFYHFALNANATQSRAVGEKHYVSSPAIDAEREDEERDKDREFIATMEPEILTITSHDQLTLQGYLYEQPEYTNNWVFAVHGYTGSARQMTRWNRQLYELGYNVFAPDLRGHGESEGDYYGMGWLDKTDLQQWLQLLLDKYPEANVTLYGVSMGASAVLNLASDDIPTQVHAVIADSGFSSVQSIFETQLHSIFNLPSFPILNAANSVSKLRIGLDFNEASTVDLVQHIDIPILYIHGGEDTFVPVENVYQLADSTTSPHSVWVVDDANHGDALKVVPDLYRKKVDEFIQNSNMEMKFSHK